MTAERVVTEATRGGADETGFDRLVKLACSIFDTPIVMLSLLEGDRAVFRSNAPLSMGSMPREQSVSHAVAALGEAGVLVVEDASAAAPFNAHPMVTGPDAIRFYAGAAITTRDGRIAGAFSVLDRKPRSRPDDRMLSSLRLLAGMAGDILDQADATRLVREQLGVLTMAEQMSGVGKWRLDLATRQVTWSEEVYRIHGASPETFDPSFDDAVSLYHPEDRDAVRACVKRCIDTGEDYEFKLRIVRPDGGIRIVISRGMVEQDESGRPVAVYGVFQDVTEAETAHARIVESEARFRLLTDRATDIIVSYGVDGIITYISPSVERVTGRKPGALIGRPVTDLILEDDVPALTESFKALVRAPVGAPSRGVRYRGRNMVEGEQWFEARTALIRDEAGQVIAFHDVVRDVTATKQLEDELIAARDAAETAARVQSEFLANMSHELRTPLTSVVGFSGLLQASEALPEAERRYADRIATSSEALLSVINDILDYSKLEAEAVDLEPQPFDPAAMARGAALIVERQCEAKGLNLVVDVATDLPDGLMGDEGRLRQVTLNFLSNAVKFTVSGEIRLEVSRSEGRLRVAVTDSGIGISAGKIEALFERFTQADASTTRVYGGTGLGLSISRRLIELMGGTIGAESRPGEGSTFWFEIPLVEAQTSQVEAEAEVQAESLPAGLRVLMADDAPANRELVRIILAGWDIELDAVCDGAEAVQAVQCTADVYDLILMDVHMPVMDGMAATRAIRALDGEVARTPILALTANVQPDQVEACRRAGMDGHVGKPIQIGDLIRAMAQAVAGSDRASGRAAA
ncbi:MAG: PAS domain-containing protein [Alphaproteobacteria bacterium]|uniref:Putative GHKL domain containing protein n=1 Tax=viral metagenome TaxID=1070528 RepID=A0A6H1ZRM9_9ZZZZ|nr:PAS domain-containing protein [Alphaproteobacteria bacterium]MBU2377771.1 PAS domain-containing protein [Alphaproteobacteria bacterium]